MDGLYGNNFQADPTDNVESSKDGDIETDDRVGQIYCKKCRQSEIPLCDERKLEVERLWLCGHFGPSSMRMNGTDLDLYLLTNHHKTSGRPGTPAPEESDENDEFLDCSSKCSDFSERHKSFTPQESDESDEDLDCSSECSYVSERQESSAPVPLHEPSPDRNRVPARRTVSRRRSVFRPRISRGQTTLANSCCGAGHESIINHFNGCTFETIRRRKVHNKNRKSGGNDGDKWSFGFDLGLLFRPWLFSDGSIFQMNVTRVAVSSIAIPWAWHKGCSLRTLVGLAACIWARETIEGAGWLVREAISLSQRLVLQALSMPWRPKTIST